MDRPAVTRSFGRTADELPVVTSYERRLDADARWALLEGSRHFKETSAVLQQQGRKRYVTRWHNQRLISKASTADEMIASLRAAADELEAIRRDGVLLDVLDGSVRLATTDPDIAKKYDMIEESEFFADDEGAGTPAPE